MGDWPVGRPCVIIPALNAGAVLPTAIESARRQRVDEIVVALGPSTDDSAGVLERLAGPDLTVIENPSGRTPDALNLAIAASSGEVVVRCDAQSVLQDGYVRRAQEVMAETGAAVVGGIQDAVGETPFERAVAATMWSGVGHGRAKFRVGGEPGPAETVYLGVFRRSVLEAVGGFDPELARNQDFELNHRIRSHGHEVYFHPDLRVQYRPRGSLKGLWSQYWQYGAGKRFMLRRSLGSLLGRQAAPLALLAGLITGALLWGFTTLGPWPLVALLGTYLVFLARGAWGVRDRDGWRSVVLISPVMHLAWALGFLLGGTPGAR